MTERQTEIERVAERKKVTERERGRESGIGSQTHRQTYNVI